MKGRIFCHASTIASLLLLVAVPTQASPIKFADVVNVMGDLHRGSHTEHLRLRAAQDASAPLNVRASARGVSGAFTPATDEDVVAASNELTATENSSNTSLVAGLDIAPQQTQGEVQVFDQDQVSGTICDCGEIPAVGGGFPKWPFLLLIPLVCLTGICFDDGKKIPPPPPPTPTPPIPEPTSLLLLGSGIAALSAGARRRYAKMKAAREAATMSEV